MLLNCCQQCFGERHLNAAPKSNLSGTPAALMIVHAASEMTMLIGLSRSTDYQ